MVTKPEYVTIDSFSSGKNPSGTTPITPFNTCIMIPSVQELFLEDTVFHQSGLYHIGRIHTYFEPYIPL